MLKRILLAAAMTASLSMTAQAADQMVFTAWGGTTQEAQKKAFADTFTAQSGVEVLQDGPTDYGKLKAMVESGNVTWDGNGGGKLDHGSGGIGPLRAE